MIVCSALHGRVVCASELIESLHGRVVIAVGRSLAAAGKRKKKNERVEERRRSALSHCCYCLLFGGARDGCGFFYRHPCEMDFYSFMSESLLVFLFSFSDTAAHWPKWPIRVRSRDCFRGKWTRCESKIQNSKTIFLTHLSRFDANYFVTCAFAKKKSGRRKSKKSILDGTCRKWNH